MDPIQADAIRIQNVLSAQQEAMRKSNFDRTIDDRDALPPPPHETSVEETEGRFAEDYSDHRPPPEHLPKGNYGADGHVDEVDKEEPGPGPSPAGHIDIRI